MLALLFTSWVFLHLLTLTATNDGETNQPDQPRRQPVITTSSVTLFRRWMQIALSLRNDIDPEADDALIVVIHGKSGLGKTFAIRAFLESVTERTITGHPRVLRIEVKQKITAKGLAKQILTALGEVPRSREFYDYVDEVKEAIIGSGVALFIFDEADRLNEETFEFLRSMTDLTRVPITLVGLPTILQVIKPHKKFRDRVAMELPFKAIEEEELFNLFLPQLVLPRWSFDSNNPDDQEMGRYLWKRVRPVLRRVRKILRIASKIAAVDGDEQIQLDHIKEAFTLDPGKMFDKDETDDEDDEADTVDERHGPHEEESEQRRDAKERKKGQRRKQQ